MTSYLYIFPQFNTVHSIVIKDKTLQLDYTMINYHKNSICLNICQNPNLEAATEGRGFYLPEAILSCCHCRI